MARVRFHCICDACGAHGEEYTFFPTCGECGDEVCLACATNVDADVDYYRCTCTRCAAESVIATSREHLIGTAA